jgi:predicted acetyltransferase
MTDLRPVAADELPDYLAQAGAAFFSEPDSPQALAARLAAIESHVNLGAFEDGRLVGTARMEPLSLTVPGARVPAAGVGLVTVLPTHRRRGIMTAMLRRLVDEAHERGDPFAALFASEGAIYRRYGFGVASYEMEARIARHRGAFRAQADVAGLRLVPWPEGVAVLRSLVERLSVSQPGVVRRGGAWWRYLATSPPPRGVPWQAVVRAEGDGVVAYERRGEFRRGGSIQVNWLFAETPAAYAALWRYCLDVDLNDEVRARWRPVDEPLRHLLADPRALEATVSDGLWLLLLDVEAALAARTYGPGAPVRIHVQDDFCQWNTGTYEVGDGGCRRAAAEADLALAAEALGACYLGANRFATLARAGLVEERTPGAAGRADVLFAAPRAPWCPFHF